MSILKSQEYKEEIKSDTILDNKIVLAIDEKSKKIANILMYIMFIILFLTYILILFAEPSFLIIFLPITLGITVFLFCYVNNPKIEIENFLITKTDFFRKIKKIGYMSEITSFCNNNAFVIVLKDNKKFFSFNIYGKESNSCVYDYLKNKYKRSLFVMGNKFEGVVFLFLGIGAIIIFQLAGRDISLLVWKLVSLYIVYMGIDEFIKRFQIIDEQIIYKRLFVNKKINLSDLTRIKYKEITSFELRGVRITNYTVMGFNGNSKVFKMDRFTIDDINLLMNISKKYGINMYY